MAERSLKMSDGKKVRLAVYQSTKIELGKMVSINAAGYLIEAALTAGTNCIGFALETVDNSSGGDGALYCDVACHRAAWFDNSAANAVDLADIGGSCYVEDDETVRDYIGGGVNVRAGEVLAVNSTDGVLVLFDAASGDAYVAGALAVATTLSVGGASTFSDDIGIAAGKDITGAGALEIGVATGAFDLTINMGDAAGAQKVSFTDSADAEVASINSDGLVTCVGVTSTGPVVGSILQGDYANVATGAAPSQAQMVAAFGAGADGQIGIFNDSTSSQPYLCAFSTLEGGWWYLALTAVGA